MRTVFGADETENVAVAAPRFSHVHRPVEVVVRHCHHQAQDAHLLGQSASGDLFGAYFGFWFKGLK
jgi:hypothetical protein